MNKSDKVVIVAKIICALFVVLPFTIAYMLDPSLTGCCHIPIIGVAAVSVALCDALFGQIVSQTAWIPFASYHTPSEASKLVDQFERFHRQTFGAWIVIKLFSALAVVLSAVLIVLTKDGKSYAHTSTVIAIGYISLGVSLYGIVFFLSTYFQSRIASNDAKLNEMMKQYEKMNPCSGTSLDEKSLAETERVFDKYNSKPSAISEPEKLQHDAQQGS